MDRTEALQALGEVDRTQRRSAASAYSKGAGPHLILWGLVWLGCGLGAKALPEHAGPVWLAGVLVGAVGGFTLGFREARRIKVDWTPTARLHVARLLGATAAMVVFYGVASALLGIWGQERQALFAGLLVALGYILIGIWQAAAMVWAGLALAALLLLGWFLFPAGFLLWLGCVGGATLALTGAWMLRSRS